MLSLHETLNILGYGNSPNFIAKGNKYPENLEKYFHDLSELNSVKGIYFVQTRPQEQKKERVNSPAVIVSKVHDETEARELHKKIWNLGYIPFLIILLPTEIRIYNGFNYSRDNDELNILGKTDTNRIIDVKNLLEKLNSISIDSKSIWKSTLAEKITPETRVDKKLLANLKKLSLVLENAKLGHHLSNSLIGKFVYLKYLQHRNILTDEWMQKNSINYNDVFSVDASIYELEKLVVALEDKFNGKIFPIDFKNEKSLKDKHIQWVAAVFSGGQIATEKNLPEPIIQLHLDFEAYNFEYIPVETLSMIYEQFIEDRKKKGAIYTPEFLADYLLSEVKIYKPILKGTKILDPACGSGIFLVIAYRRLIEKERKRLGRNLRITELKDRLVDSIYGVERELDACYVAEFSLILTLLHYADPSELHRLGNFQFPELHNKNIIHADFFDIKGADNDVTIWDKEIKFDIIIGNPPWIKAEGDRGKHVLEWINSNSYRYPVGRKSVAEAFCWISLNIMNTNGIAGLLLPTTSFVNSRSKKFRKRFFEKIRLLRITNFANLRDILFDSRSKMPATTLIFNKQVYNEKNYSVTHIRPLRINTNFGEKKRLWIINLTDQDFQQLSNKEIEKGDVSTWKYALLGTYLDKRLVEKLENLFPLSFIEFSKKHHWGSNPGESIQLRDKKDLPIDELEYIPTLKGLLKFEPKIYDKLFIKPKLSLPKSCFIENTDYYIRKRGGKAGLRLNFAPHLILSPTWQNYIAFSDIDFIVPQRPKTIAVPKDDEKNKKLLKSLSLFFHSSISAYFIFFHVPAWGIDSHRKGYLISELQKLPTPDFTNEQISALSTTHDKLVNFEKQSIANFIDELIKKNNSQMNMLLGNDSDTYDLFDPSFQKTIWRKFRKDIIKFNEEHQKELKRLIDNAVFSILEMPIEIKEIITDFINFKLPLDSPSSMYKLISQKVKINNLKSYARALRDELDSFMMGEKHHKISILYSDNLIECQIEMTDEGCPIPMTQDSIRKSDLTISSLMLEISDSLRTQFSQWVYIQRGLKLYDEETSTTYIYKQPRLVDWTKTQAMIDAGEIINKNLSHFSHIHEVN